MRIGFAGSHDISWYCLKALCELARRSPSAAVAGVFNLPAETGRAHSAFVEFDALVELYGVPHYRVTSLSSEETLRLLRSLELDVLFIIGWHRIVPQSVIDVAPYCLGIHSSLLPKNRGSAPINWALIRGEREGGLSLFHLTTGVDAGPLVGQQAFPIGPDDTCRDVYDRATVAAVQLLHAHWPALLERRLPRIPQDESQATYNDRRRPADGAIDWTAGVRRVHDLVRALTHPYPGAFTTFRGRRLLLWRASCHPGPQSLQPGTIVSVGDSIRVAGADGYLEIASLTPDGGLECSAAVFTAAYAPVPGERMGDLLPATVSR